jgi:hypothetical protein
MMNEPAYEKLVELGYWLDRYWERNPDRVEERQAAEQHLAALASLIRP